MATDNTIMSFTLDLDELGWTGQDLQRPESVVAEPDGTLWASDGRGGVMRIDPDGGRRLPTFRAPVPGQPMRHWS